jgi:hypothetical protein
LEYRRIKERICGGIGYNDDDDEDEEEGEARRFLQLHKGVLAFDVCKWWPACFRSFFISSL